MNKKNPLTNRKLIAVCLFALSFVLFLVFLGRFTVIMVKGQVNGEDLNQNVVNMYTRSSILKAERGSIYDVNGAPIAMDATSYKLVAVLTDKWSPDEENPRHVVDKSHTATTLAKYLPMEEEEILALLSKEKLAQVEFGSAGNNLPYDTKVRIEEEKLPGIEFIETPTRLYPNGIFASHLVGLAQLPQNEDGAEEVSNDDLSGVLGIEKAYDDLLTGINGELKYKKNRFGYALPNEEVKMVESTDGSSLYLTIDKRIQTYMENVMTQVQEENESAAVTATLMDAETGAILAASQRPTFDATTKEGIDQTWQNYLSEYTFEPGSTLKVMTLAAAVEENKFHPNNYFKSGKVDVEGGRVHDVKREGWGTISYLEGVARSSNVAFVNLVDEMGLDTWKAYLDEFGFGQSTESGLLNESGGMNPYKWPLQKYNTSFGQGISVTVLQMMQAYSVVANEGKMVQPYFIDKIHDLEKDEWIENEPVYQETSISKEAAQKTLDYLKEPVYSENGTAKGYQIEGYEIAAKTGTAQLVNPETGNYYTGSTDHIYSVVGMAPADNPKVILYITVQQPTLGNGVGHGSGVVRKIYTPIMKRALDLYTDNATNDLSDLIDTEVPKVTNVTVDEGKQLLEESGFEVGIVGTGDTIVQQLPHAHSFSADSQKVVLLTNGASIIPDMTGWSKNDAMKVAEITGISLVVEGDGYVVSQSLAPGQSMHTEEEIVIQLNQGPEDTE